MKSIYARKYRAKREQKIEMIMIFEWVSLIAIKLLAWLLSCCNDINTNADAYATAATVAVEWQKIANVAFLNEMKINESFAREYFALITTPLSFSLRHS